MSINYSRNSYDITTPPPIITEDYEETMHWDNSMTNDVELEYATKFSKLLNARQTKLQNKPIATELEVEVEDTPFTLPDYIDQQFQQNMAKINNMSINLPKQAPLYNEHINSDISKSIDTLWPTIRTYIKYLTDLGASIQMAAGICGNLWQESKFNPKAIGDKGKSKGTFQMSSAHWKNFYDECKKNNWDPNTEESVTKYAYNQALNSKSKYGNEITTDPIQAMYWFSDTFLKPDPDKANYNARRQATIEIYNRMIGEMSSTNSNNPPTLNVTGQDIVNYGRTLLGGKYLWGGKTDPQKGLDCSGFVQFIYKQYGIPISGHTKDQLHDGLPVENLSHAKPGDIIIVHSTQSDSDYHAEIFVGNINGTYYTMGARGKDSGIKLTPFPFQEKAIVGIRRIIDTQT